MTYSVYMVRCADATLYTGIARDLPRRLAQHNGLTPTGKESSTRLGAAYTAARRPVELVYCAQAPTRSDAQKEEARLKRLTRAEKLELIDSTRAKGRPGDTQNLPTSSGAPGPRPGA